MFKCFRKFGSNKGGFTLTEVMIGIMILTVAIVSSSNLLVSLVNTNKNNVKVLQAYYLAQEGIEAVRNIRDTNWLHNLDFKGEVVGGVYDLFEIDSTYKVFLTSEGWANSSDTTNMTKLQLNSMKPFEFVKTGGIPTPDPFSEEFALTKNEYSTGRYFSNGPSDEAEYYRHIEILPYCKEDATEEEQKECENFILVKSVVNWRDGSDENEISLDAVLSNWKGGAM